MYAHILRKWSLTKFLMYLPTVIIVLLVFWSQGASTMRLEPFIYGHRDQTVESVETSSNTDQLAAVTNNNYHLPFRQQQQQQQHHHRHQRHHDLLLQQHQQQHQQINDDVRQRTEPVSRQEPIPSSLKDVLNQNVPNLIYSSQLNKISEYLGSANNLNIKNDNLKLDRLNVDSTKLIKYNEEPASESHSHLKQFRRLNKENIKESPTNLKLTVSKESTQNELSPINHSMVVQMKRTEPKLLKRHLRWRRHRLPLLAMPSGSVDDNDDEEFRTPAHLRSTVSLSESSELLIGRNRRESKRGFVPATVKRRFCTARDPTTLAFEAPTVFEGKVRSMSSNRTRTYNVTFEVKEIYKKQSDLKLPDLVRLQFITTKNNGGCDIYREKLRSTGIIRNEFDIGHVYILFVNQISLNNFTILGQPIKKSRNIVKQVKNGVSDKYGKVASIEKFSVNNETIRIGRRIRFICKVQGQPPPKVTWFKDGRSIRNRTKYQFVHMRRRAELIIEKAERSDAGRYECRAKNKLTRPPVSLSIRLNVTAESNTKAGWPAGVPCPSIEFCQNGGVCVFFAEVSEPACQCPEGFDGHRCESKRESLPIDRQSTYNNNNKDQHCGDEQYLGTFYC